MIQFSVIIPFYEVESYIEEAIESVLNQSYSNWELILIDDGSKDKSREIALKYTKLDARIKLFSHEKKVNKGVSASRNLGIIQASGDWISFLDADDSWFPDKLEIENKVLLENENLAIIYSKSSQINSSNKKLNLNKAYGSGKPGLIVEPFRKTIKGVLVSFSSVTVNKKIVHNNKLFFNTKMRFSEDTLFFHEIQQFGSLFFISQTLSYYRISDVSTKNKIPELEKIEGRFEVYRYLLERVNTSLIPIVSFEIVNSGFEKIWKYFIFNPKKCRKLFFKNLRIIISHRKINFLHKLLVFIGPLSILVKFIIKKL